ncbi:gas vesicle structural protein GvpA [Kitasatospora sp. NPDC006697]|uniref:gas vesicle structural protein GvpA n=1 Tax=Kitasatospora sp. NPDC006697 TaxID=3364020 RepID=UPI00369CABDF
MTVVPQGATGASRSGTTANLYDIVELILDRGLVIDVFIRVSLVGIELLKIDVRIVVASVDTYLRFAEACNRLNLESGRNAPAQLTDIVGETTEKGARGKSKGALSGAVEAVSDSLRGRGNDEDEDERQDEDEREPEAEEAPAPRRKRPARRSVRRQEEE